MTEKPRKIRVSVFEEELYPVLLVEEQTNERKRKGVYLTEPWNLKRWKEAQKAFLKAQEEIRAFVKDKRNKVLPLYCYKNIYNYELTDRAKKEYSRRKK